MVRNSRLAAFVLAATVAMLAACSGTSSAAPAAQPHQTATAANTIAAVTTTTSPSRQEVLGGSHLVYLTNSMRVNPARDDSVMLVGASASQGKTLLTCVDTLRELHAASPSSSPEYQADEQLDFTSGNRPDTEPGLSRQDHIDITFHGDYDTTYVPETLIVSWFRLNEQGGDELVTDMALNLRQYLFHGGVVMRLSNDEVIPYRNGELRNPRVCVQR